MSIQPFPSGPFDTNAYLVSCPKTNHAAIIDPAPDSFEKVSAYILKNKLIPQAIWLTHSHWDHIADVSKLKKSYQIPVLIHPLDAPNLEKPGSDGLPCWIEIEGVIPDGWLNDQEKVALGDLSFDIIHTPGHTPGGICLHFAQGGFLFSGDTLFRGTIGNLSFPTSQPDLMWDSLNKLAKLPAKTVVYPGHGPATTIGNESWLSNAKKYFGNSF